MKTLTALRSFFERPSIAEKLRRAHQLPEGKWFIVSPVCWQATFNDVLITAAGPELNLSDSDSQHWMKLLSEWLQAEKMTLYYHNPWTWLLRADEAPPLKAKPVMELVGLSLKSDLHALDTTLYWQRLLTESQMVMNSANVMQTKVDSVNGIWIWKGEALKLSETIVWLWRQFKR